GRALAPLPPARSPPRIAPGPCLRPAPLGAPRHAATTPALAGAAASAGIAHARAAATNPPALSTLPAGVPDTAPPALPRRVRHLGERRRHRPHRASPPPAHHRRRRARDSRDVTMTPLPAHHDEDADSVPWDRCTHRTKSVLPSPTSTPPGRRPTGPWPGRRP